MYICLNIKKKETKILFEKPKSHQNLGKKLMSHYLFPQKKKNLS